MHILAPRGEHFLIANMKANPKLLEEQLTSLVQQYGKDVVLQCLHNIDTPNQKKFPENSAHEYDAEDPDNQDFATKLDKWRDDLTLAMLRYINEDE